MRHLKTDWTIEDAARISDGNIELELSFEGIDDTTFDEMEIVEKVIVAAPGMLKALAEIKEQLELSGVINETWLLNFVTEAIENVPK